MPDSNIKVSDFSSHLFWDVKPDTLNTDLHQQLIVERVIQRGSLKDLSLLEQFYNRESIRAVISQLPWLNEKDMAFVHIYFDIPYDDLKCYTKRQSAHYC